MVCGSQQDIIPSIHGQADRQGSMFESYRGLKRTSLPSVSLHIAKTPLYSLWLLFLPFQKGKGDVSEVFRPTLSHISDQTQLGLPKLTQIYSTHGKGKGTTRCHLNIKKTQNNFPSISETSMMTTPHREFTQSGLTGFNRDHNQGYIQE